MRVASIGAAVCLAACVGCRSQAREPVRNDGATRQQIAAKVERLNQLLSARDKAIVEEFADDPDVMLLGSEADELAIGREQLGPFFDGIFKLPFTLSWDWKDTRIASLDDVAWVYTNGNLVMKSTDGEMRAPYRMTGVLERRNGAWYWRQFHGSEPAKPQ